ncbi:conserved hypothetical protein [Neospora caninum Liverpool]|nr:conserved hypothetical protein [Neospora caninum Liverpool]CBZ51017.1 conserved hypothetical protein [Neospora caninum Liverpool]|eukprot:XP_003881050.1 conserved hypothetical protein [Neospora caninum Liverpool]
MSERSITLPAYLTRYSQFSSPLPLLSAEYGDSLRGSALSGWSSHLASGPSFACPPLRLLSPSSPPLWEALTHFSSPAATLFQGLLPRLSRSPALSLQPCPAAVGPLPSSASSSFSRSRPSGSVGSLACSLSPKKEKDRSVPSVCSPSKGSTPRTKPRSRGGGSEGRADENGATGRELKRRGKRMRCDEMTHGNWTLDGGLTEGEENERNGLRKNEETRIKCRRMCGKCMHFRERENERKAAQTCECRRCWQCASIRGHRQTTGNQTSFGNNGNDWAPYLLGLRGPNVWRLWHENVEQKRREVTESECSGMCIRGKGAWKEGEKGRAGRVSPSCARGGHHHQERRDRELGLLGWILRHTGDPVSPLFAQTLIEHAFQGTLEWTEYEDKALIG